MQRDIRRLKDRQFDILVVGGGISGAAIAWDAALRGYDVALIEKKDYGHATSMATSKLIHGDGLRYLAGLDFPLVRESLRERRLLSQNAPHQVFPLGTLIPIYDYTPSKRSKLKVGLTLYDWLSYDKNDLSDSDKYLPNHQYLSAEEALQLESTLSREGLKGAFYYYDGLNKHPERINIDFLHSAYEKSAHLANYVEASDFIIEEVEDIKKVVGVKAKDLLTDEEFKIHAKITINATGPWADLLLAKLNDRPVRKLQRAKGIHLLFRRFTQNNVISFETRDKHHFFFIPWLKYSLLGTSDTQFTGHPDELTVTSDEAQDFINLVRQYYPVNISLKDVIHAYVGIRPLVTKSGDSSSTYKALRKHEIINHRKAEKVFGLISVLGSKYTTSRGLAEAAVDIAMKEADLPKNPCRTANTPISGGHVGKKLSTFTSDAIARYKNDYSSDLISHLIEYYGSNYEKLIEVLKKEKCLDKRIDDEIGHIAAEIVYAVDQESAIDLSDFMLRRSGIGNCGIPTERVLCGIAEVMGRVRRWDRTAIKEQIKKYKDGTGLKFV